MRLALICFTESGAHVLRKLLKGLKESGHLVNGYRKGEYDGRENGEMKTVEDSLGKWTGEQFGCQDGMIFIGAAGIAVRAIAPFVKEKQTDPAVVVLDDMGRFAISLLSGHAGGANALAEEAARIVGGVPVITTATDIHGKFPVDRFAMDRGLWMDDWEKAKRISAGLLAGKKVGLFSDFPVVGEPDGGLLKDLPGDENIWITVCQRADDKAFSADKEGRPEKVLRLVPRVTALGVGCRKDISCEAIRKAVKIVFEEENLALESVEAVVSLDLKKEEAGLLEFAGKLGVLFRTYSVKELSEVPGVFTPSDFVKEVTGVDNVCERAALLWTEHHGGGHLRIRKRAVSGVTVAAAVREWKVEL